MSPPDKVVYISSAAEAAACARARVAIEHAIAGLQAGVENALERIEHLKGLAAHLEAKHGPTTQGETSNVKESAIIKRSSGT